MSDEKETYTKADIEMMLAEKETALKAEFQAHISRLNEEAKKHRLDAKSVKELMAQSLGLNPEEKTDKELLETRFNEIIGKTKELENQLLEAKREKELISKQNQLKELAKKEGLNEMLALKLANLEAENLEQEVKNIALEYGDAIKVKKEDITSGMKPANASDFAVNPYSKATFNLTKQAMLEIQNPALASKLKLSAQ